MFVTRLAAGIVAVLLVGAAALYAYLVVNGDEVPGGLLVFIGAALVGIRALLTEGQLVDERNGTKDVVSQAATKADEAARVGRVTEKKIDQTQQIAVQTAETLDLVRTALEDTPNRMERIEERFDRLEALVREMGAR